MLSSPARREEGAGSKAPDVPGKDGEKADKEVVKEVLVSRSTITVVEGGASDR